MIQVWFSNRTDDGRPARSYKELPTPRYAPLLQFIFPNIWQNRLSDNFRLVIAFIPIDNENTRMYIRAYQNMIQFPVLKPIVHFFSKIGNYFIQWQDRKVVETQSPKPSGLKIGEQLVPGDRPIILYRKRRDALMAEYNESQ